MFVNEYWVRVDGGAYFVRFESHSPLKWFTHPQFRKAYCFASAADAARIADQLIRCGYRAEVVTLQRTTPRASSRRRTVPRRRSYAQAPKPPEHLRYWVEKIVEAAQASGAPPTEALRSGYLSLARQHHPDLGGSTADMQAVNEAFSWLRQNGRPEQFHSGATFDDVPF